MSYFEPPSARAAQAAASAAARTTGFVNFFLIARQFYHAPRFQVNDFWLFLAQQKG
jgi:hypothetical protein